MLGRAGKGLGPGLWEAVASDPEKPTLSAPAVVVISPNTAVDFVYNVLEIPVFLCATFFD